MQHFPLDGQFKSLQLSPAEAHLRSITPSCFPSTLRMPGASGTPCPPGKLALEGT